MKAMNFYSPVFRLFKVFCLILINILSDSWSLKQFQEKQVSCLLYETITLLFIIVNHLSRR